MYSTSINFVTYYFPSSKQAFQLQNLFMKFKILSVITKKPFTGHEKLVKDFKGQLISKTNCQAVSSSKIRTNEFVFTSMRRVFVPFLEEIEDSKKAFRNDLTFNFNQNVVLPENKKIID